MASATSFEQAKVLVDQSIIITLITLIIQYTAIITSIPTITSAADSMSCCSLHVASVVQMMHMIMHHGGLLRRKVCDELMMLACYIAAAIHDYEHGGVNNDFLIQTRDKLAVMYNDISPLENHHLAAAARLIGEPRYRFTEVDCRNTLTRSYTT